MKHWIIGIILLGFSFIVGAQYTQVSQVQMNIVVPQWHQENLNKQSNGTYLTSRNYTFILVFVNGIAQSPGIDYTKTGNIITLIDSELALGNNIVFVTGY